MFEENLESRSKEDCVKSMEMSLSLSVQSLKSVHFCNQNVR